MKPTHVLLGFAAVLGGMLLGWWIGDRGPSSAVPSVDAPSSATAPNPELRELLEELRGLRADLRMVQPEAALRAPASERTPPELGPVLAELAQLAETLRERRREDAPSGTALLLKKPTTATGFATRAALADASSRSELTAVHRFWSMREVLERYGQPNTVQFDRGQLEFWFRPEDEAKQPVVFRFFDGLVTEVDVR